MDCLQLDEVRAVAVPSGPLVVPPQTHGKSCVKLSMVIPTYNEGHHIAALLNALGSVLAAEVGGSYELIVVDDDSPDGTWKIAGEIAAGDPRITVLRRTGERGLATAVVRGWQVAQGEVLGVIDGDLQHPPAVVGELWSAIARGADLAVASRRVPGGGVGRWSLWRRMTSRGAQLLGAVLLPGVAGTVRDPMSGFFLVRRFVLEGVRLRPRGFKILLEVLGRTRPCRVAEVGYVFCSRQNGVSKATLGIFWDYLLHLLRLRFSSPAGPAPLPTGSSEVAASPASLRQKS
jgi:dolichol-phosphate mannosyltransferase